MAHLYFREDLRPEHVPGLVTLTGDEARHAVRVSRLKVGEKTLIGNGAGLLCHGVVTEATSEAFTVDVTEVSERAVPATRAWIIQALAKGDRSDRAIELATEFGAHGFIPWQAERSIVKWDGRKAEQGREKWQRIAREASKQSLRAFIPQVVPAVTTADICEIARSPQHRVIVLHPGDAEPLSSLLAELHEQELYLCVGPEGGVSDTELRALRNAGAEIARLGDEVLRTSSAGAAALATLNVASGRW